MTTREAFEICDNDVCRQSLRTIFFTLEQEKLGSAELMQSDMNRPTQARLLRLLDSVLLAHKNLHGAAHEALRERCS